MNCPKCNYSCADDWKQCPICGQTLSPPATATDLEPNLNANRVSSSPSTGASWLTRLKQPVSKVKTPDPAPSSPEKSPLLEIEDLFADDPVEATKKMLSNHIPEHAVSAPDSIPETISLKAIPPTEDLSAPPVPTEPFEMTASSSVLKVVEFAEDDSILAQQIDDLLSDNIESIEAIKSRTNMPVINNQTTAIIEDGLEIEFEVDIGDEAKEGTTPAKTIDLPKKTLPISPVGGLLDAVETNIKTAPTSQVFAQNNSVHSKQDPLIALLENGLQHNKMQTVEERLQNILNQTANSSEAQELCSLVAEAHGLSPHHPAEVKQPLATTSPINSSPVQPAVCANDWACLDEELAGVAPNTELNISLAELASTQPTAKLTAIFDELEYELICGGNPPTTKTSSAPSAQLNNRDIKKALSDFEKEEIARFEEKHQLQKPHAHPKIPRQDLPRYFFKRTIEFVVNSLVCLFLSLIVCLPFSSLLKVIKRDNIITEEWLPYLPQAFLCFGLTLLAAAFLPSWTTKKS